MEEVAIIADFRGPGFDFAKGVYNYLKNKKGREFSVNLIDIKKTVFKDGEFKVKIAENIRGERCFFIHDSNKAPCEWISELIFTLEAMSFSSPKEINIVLPYTRFARQDRKDESRVSVNAKAIASIISFYAHRGLTVDLHAPQMQGYFDIPFDNLYSYPSLINHLTKNHSDILDKIVVVSPDLGGGKRAEYFAKRLNENRVKAEIAFGHKSREKDNEVSKTIIIGDVAGKNCLIIDDIIDTGGTMIKTAQALKEKGANKIYAYGTHALFTAGIHEFNIFDKLLVSDTLKTNSSDIIETVSLVNLFGEAIYRTIMGKSLSILFADKTKNPDSPLSDYVL
jgi:ribose-phosphate pyrophosphokinase